MPNVKIPKHVIALGLAWAAILMIQFVFPSGGQSTATHADLQDSPAALAQTAFPETP
jgi:hypothetical protein